MIKVLHMLVQGPRTSTAAICLVQQERHELSKTYSLMKVLVECHWFMEVIGVCGAPLVHRIHLQMLGHGFKTNVNAKFELIMKEA
ncbi:hypothetical protein GOP47_0029321 [Adiantum capillus-veneris]|nr:hypothetical protein GOP47_0029321 [Adiantum capillus-veneris]